MKYEVAGDPVSGLRWTRKTTKKIAAELSALGIRVSRKTVAKLLKQMNFSLRTNKKKISNGSPPTRDAQFANITQLRERFSRRGNPILSVDTKKKELVGRFKNPGRVWAQKSDAVNDHDFRSMADGVAIPYGNYDLQSNRGTVYVGTSYDTSQFAVECIEKWWRSEGQKRFPGRKHLLVVADTGGSNGATRRAWKHGIQHKLCNEHGLDVTVAHYPPGASKWNPIEHRLFSEISKNWAGRPLDSYETILNFIRTTKTKTAMPSTTTTFAPWQMGSQSHTATMISRVIEAPCMSERLTTRRNSQSNASRSGGALKVRSVFPAANIYLS